MKNSFLIKNKALITVLVFLALLLCFSAGAPQVQKNDLTWSLGLQNQKTMKLVSLNPPVQLITGDSFFVLVEPQKDCYLYLIAESVQNEEIIVYYAGSCKGGVEWRSPEIRLIPPEGTENFFVVVSLAEQAALAQRISAFNSDSGIIQRRALMNEVFRIRAEVSNLVETPEKPVLMGGALRGSEEENAREFSGVGTYVKTISIEH